jgi:hypothetical protein
VKKKKKKKRDEGRGLSIRAKIFKGHKETIVADNSTLGY